MGANIAEAIAEANEGVRKVTLQPDQALVALYCDLAVHLLTGMSAQLGGPCAQQEPANVFSRFAMEMGKYRESYVQRAALRVQLAAPQVVP